MSSFSGEGASMDGLPRTENTEAKPEIVVEVDGKSYPLHIQKEGVFSLLTTDGRSFVNEPDESKEDFIKRALKAGLELRETK